MMRLIVATLACLVLAGCSESGGPSGGSSSGAQDVIDTMTQKKKVAAGVEAANKIIDISDERNAELEEIK